MESTTLVTTNSASELYAQAEAATEARSNELVLTDCDFWIEAACRHKFANKAFVCKVRRGKDSFEPLPYSNTPPAFVSKLHIDKEVTSFKIDRFHLSLQTKDTVIKYVCNVESKRTDGTAVLGHEFISLISSIQGMQEQKALYPTPLLVELGITQGTTTGVCFPKLSTPKGWTYWSKAYKSTLINIADLEAQKEFVYQTIDCINNQLLGA